MAVFKCYPASWAEHSAMEPGDLVFAVTRESLTEPDTRGRRHIVNNSLYFNWRDAHSHGTASALPGQFVTARTLWPDVADPDRGALVAAALASERLVQVGVVDSVTPDRIGVAYSRQGLQYLYGVSEDASRDEIVAALARYHGLNPRDTSTDYAPEKCLADYIGILTASEEPAPSPKSKKATADSTAYVTPPASRAISRDIA